MDLDGICLRVTEPKPGQVMLAPGDEFAAEIIAKFPRKKDVIARFDTPRSPEHHKFYFVYLSRVVKAVDDIWKDKDELLQAVKFAVGHTTRFRRVGNPHAKDMGLANEIASETLYVRRQDENGSEWFEPLPVIKVAKIIMALRRGADEYVTLPKSINFASMGEEKFKEFHDKTVLALNTFLGWDTSQLMEKKNDTV